MQVKIMMTPKVTLELSCPILKVTSLTSCISLPTSLPRYSIYYLLLTYLRSLQTTENLVNVVTQLPQHMTKQVIETLNTKKDSPSNDDDEKVLIF